MLRLPAELRARAPRLSFSLLPKRGAERRDGANRSRCEARPPRLRGVARPFAIRDARLSALHRGDFGPGAALPSPALPPESAFSELLAARSIVPGGRGPEPSELAGASRRRGTPLPAPPSGSPLDGARHRAGMIRNIGHGEYTVKIYIVGVYIACSLD